MASPHVAGAAAVYRAMYPQATPGQVRMALQAVGTRDWRTATDPDRQPEMAVWIGSFRTIPDYTTSTAAHAGRLTAGAKLGMTVAVDRIGGFVDPVSIELVDPPVGISAVPVTTTGASATLELRAARGLALGRYLLVLHSVSGDVERTSVVWITVTGSQPEGTFTSSAATHAFGSGGR